MFLTSEYILNFRGCLRNNRYKAKGKLQMKSHRLQFQREPPHSLEAYRKANGFNGSNDDLIKLAFASLLYSEL